MSSIQLGAERQAWTGFSLQVGGLAYRWNRAAHLLRTSPGLGTGMLKRVR